MGHKRTANAGDGAQAQKSNSLPSRMQQQVTGLKRALFKILWPLDSETRPLHSETCQNRGHNIVTILSQYCHNIVTITLNPDPEP